MTVENPAGTPPATPPAGAPPATPPAGTPPVTPPAGAPPAAAGSGDPWFTKPEFGLAREDMDYLGGKNFGSFGDLLKTTRQFEQIARDRNAIEMPTPDKLLDWEGWQKLGYEPDLAKYTIDKPALKEGVPYAPGFHDALVKSAHSARMPLPMAKAFMSSLTEAFNADHAASLAEIAQQDATVTADMQRQWGVQYPAKIELAKRAAAALVPKDQQTMLEDIIGTPAMLQMFARIGDALGEDRLVADSNGGQGGFGGRSPEQARQERKRQESDPDFMKSLMDPEHPLHETNKAKRRQLFEIEANGQR